ncbi:MAG: hypothetical protein ABI834_06335 [Ginsengibacter sp.]
MKKVFLFATTVILLASVLSSCKKDKAETTAQKVQHNWTIVNEIDNFHDASGDHIDTINGVAGDFINFNSNGTVTSHFDGSDDSGNYSLLNDTQISINGLTFTIKTLTDSQLVLYVKDVISSDEYDEETINLKR